MKKQENKTKQETSSFTAREEVVLEGVTICPGIGIGEASLVREDITIPRIKTADGRVEKEKTRYRQAVRIVVQNLREHIKECHDYPLGNIDKILEMHEIMATDERFHDAVLERIEIERKNAEWAKGLKSSVKDHDKMIIDGIRGLVIIRPSAGTKIRLMANIENLHQVGLVLRNNREGVGLFRTEFLILTTDKVPDEEEQYEVYRKMVDVLSGKEIVVRTFDLGADKIEPGLERCTGKNPALGVRGIRRHLLHRPEELRTQLRALIRAASGSSVGILFPMITTVNDIIEVKKHLQEVKNELRDESTPFSPHVKLGAMIEIPAAAVAIQDILREVDFVSVGTNDLIQYFMAADRDNEAVLHYSDSTNAAFMHLLRFIIESAAEMGRAEDVTICGEMASDPRLVLPLINLGYRSLSISPVSAESIRDGISSIDLCRVKNGDVFRRAP